MQYLVRCLDARQQIQALALEALDEADALQQALGRQLTPLSVAAQADAGIRRSTRFSLLLFAQELLALTSAGLSLIESLDALREKETDPLRNAVLARLAQQLREGHRLSSALRQQPHIFGPLFVGIVQAAEGTSDLPRALQRFLDYEQRLQGVRHKLTSAAIYPAVLLAVGSAVSLFLLGYVVPRFAAVYQSAGRELPWASRLLLQWGDLVTQHAGMLAVGLVLLAGGGLWWARATLAAGGWLQLLAALPGAAPKVRVLELSRLYLTLGMLLEGGIPLHQALGLCASVTRADTAAALQQVRTRIAAGEPLSAALEQQGLSTPIALRLLRVGEQSGQLGAMLGRTAAFYDEDTARWIDRFSKAFEPALMAAIGLVIGLIVVLLYMPVFELAGSLQ